MGIDPHQSYIRQRTNIQICRELKNLEINRLNNPNIKCGAEVNREFSKEVSL